jgi:acetyl-CoA acetyltransferase
MGQTAEDVAAMQGVSRAEQDEFGARSLQRYQDEHDALANAGLDVADIDMFEINEAFAAQVILSYQELGIPLESSTSTVAESRWGIRSA